MDLQAVQQVRRGTESFSCCGATTPDHVLSGKSLLHVDLERKMHRSVTKGRTEACGSSVTPFVSLFRASTPLN